MAKSLLESAGIECFLRDAEMVRINWLASNLIGGIRLQVRDEDQEDALQILRKFDGCFPPIMSTETMGTIDPQIESEKPPLLYVATTNKGKLREFAQAADSYGIDVQALPTIKTIPEPAETGPTFEENAVIKAVAYSRHLPGELVIADDSGLEVEALGGAPGVNSARYAAKPGHKPSDSDNNYKLLQELGALGDVDRAARFVCVIAAARDGSLVHTFRGEAPGEILMAPVGRRGFGYDPLFYVPGAHKTFAEMNDQEKLGYSHRGAAFRKLLTWLREGGADS